MSLQPTRPLPAHEGAERLVLGALLLSSAAIDDVMPVLRPDDFSDIGHAARQGKDAGFRMGSAVALVAKLARWVSKPIDAGGWVTR